MEKQLLDDGTFPAHAWPGGYPLFYLTRDGLTVCAECANREVDDGQVVIGQDIYWEGPEMQCDDCTADIQSAYGDPNASNVDRTAIDEHFYS
jgi:hypothetical protein